jgi:hypothetical protein
MSGFGKRIASGLRWSFGGGFVVLPANNEHPTGVHADSIYQYYKLPADNNKPENENLLDTFYGARVYSGDPDDSIRTTHEVYKRFGNQYFFNNSAVYSWWFSPFGDGPISLTNSGSNTDLLNKADSFFYRPYYDGDTGFVYLAGYDRYGDPERQDVPLVIYRNGKVLTFIDVSVTDLIPGFDNSGSLIINGFGRCSYDGKERLLISLLNIYTFQTFGENVSDFEAQVILLAYEDQQLLEVSYVTPANINPPSDTDYLSICTWPWRFNSTGTECASITLEYKKTGVGSGNYFIRVVRVPLSHTAGGISVGTAIIDLYPVVSNEIARDEGTEIQETGITYTPNPDPTLPDNQSWNNVIYIDTKYGTEYEYDVTDIPIAVDYDEDDNIIFTLLSITSPGGSFIHRFQDYTNTGSRIYSRVGGLLREVTEEEGGMDKYTVQKENSAGAITLSVNGLTINFRENGNPQSDIFNSEKDSFYRYDDPRINPSAKVDNLSRETIINSTQYYFGGVPVTLIGYLSTKTKTVFVSGQSLSVREIDNYNSDYSHVYNHPNLERTVTGTTYRYVGFTSEIQYILYVNGTLMLDEVDLVAPDATEATGTVVYPTNYTYIPSDSFGGDINNVYNDTVTVEDKRGILPILNLFSTTYSSYPYTQPSYSNAAVSFVADFRKVDEDKIGWILSIEQQPNPEELENKEGRTIVKASFADDPLSLLEHAGTTTRFSTVGLY